jgi:hypothetical protein
MGWGVQDPGSVTLDRPQRPIVRDGQPHRQRRPAIPAVERVAGDLKSMRPRVGRHSRGNLIGIGLGEQERAAAVVLHPNLGVIELGVAASARRSARVHPVKPCTHLSALPRNSSIWWSRAHRRARSITSWVPENAELFRQRRHQGEVTAHQPAVHYSRPTSNSTIRTLPMIKIQGGGRRARPLRSCAAAYLQAARLDSAMLSWRPARRTTCCAATMPISPGTGRSTSSMYRRR